MKNRLRAVVCLFLILLLACTPVGAAAADGEPSFPYTLFNAIKDSGVMTERPQLIVGDVDYSGTVDAADAMWILRYSLITNPYFKQPRGWWWTLEMSYAQYYYRKPDRTQIADGGYYDRYIKNPGGGTTVYGELFYTDIRYMHYFLNAVLMADVDADSQITAADALMALQFAVGKRDELIRQDLRSTTMYYVPWPDEWVPGLMYKCSDEVYERMDPERRTFESTNPREAPAYADWMVENGYWKE